MMLNLKDTPNDRVLNMMTGLEALLMKCIETDQPNKEELTKYLGFVRKALEGAYDKLPIPTTKPKEEQIQRINLPNPDQVVWQEWRTAQDQMATQQVAGQIQQAHQLMGIPFDTFNPFRR